MEDIQLRKRNPRERETSPDTIASLDSRDPMDYRDFESKSRSTLVQTEKGYVSPLKKFRNIFDHQCEFKFERDQKSGEIKGLEIKNMHIRDVSAWVKKCTQDFVQGDRSIEDIAETYSTYWKTMTHSVIESYRLKIGNDIKRGGIYASSVFIGSEHETSDFVIDNTKIAEIDKEINDKFSLAPVARVVFVQHEGDIAKNINIGPKGMYALYIWSSDVGYRYQRNAPDKGANSISVEPVIGSKTKIEILKLWGIRELLKLFPRIRKMNPQPIHSKLVSQNGQSSIKLHWHLKIDPEQAHKGNIAIQTLLMSLIGNQFDTKMPIDIAKDLLLSSRLGENTQTSLLENPNIFQSQSMKGENSKDHHGLGFDELLNFKSKIIQDVSSIATKVRTLIGCQKAEAGQTRLKNEIEPRVYTQKIADAVSSLVFYSVKDWNMETVVLEFIQQSIKGIITKEVQRDFDGIEYAEKDEDWDVLVKDHQQAQELSTQKIWSVDLAKLVARRGQMLGFESSVFQIIGPRGTRLGDFVSQATKLIKDRTIAFDKLRNIIDKAFNPEDTKTQTERGFADNLHKSAKEFSEFLDKVFDPQNSKAYILVQSGNTNAGKSFSANCIANLMHEMNGIAIGSTIDNEFVRVANLGVRMLRIIEEFKGNIIDSFHHLEANGKQLRRNNAMIDQRINLTIVNCDKNKFDIDSEAKSLARKLDPKSGVSEKDIDSRAQQVKARTFIMLYESSYDLWYWAQTTNKLLCQLQKQFVDLVKGNGIKTLGTVEISGNVAFQRWDKSEYPKSEASTLSYETFLCHHSSWSLILENALSYTANREKVTLESFEQLIRKSWPGFADGVFETMGSCHELDSLHGEFEPSDPVANKPTPEKTASMAMDNENDEKDSWDSKSRSFKSSPDHKVISNQVVCQITECPCLAENNEICPTSENCNGNQRVSIEDESETEFEIEYTVSESEVDFEIEYTVGSNESGSEIPYSREYTCASLNDMGFERYDVITTPPELDQLYNWTNDREINSMILLLEELRIELEYKKIQMRGFEHVDDSVLEYDMTLLETHILDIQDAIEFKLSTQNHATINHDAIEEERESARLFAESQDPNEQKKQEEEMEAAALGLSVEDMKILESKGII